MSQLNKILEKVSAVTTFFRCVGMSDNANLATFSYNSKSNRVDRLRV